MFPASRAAAIAISKNLTASCARTTSVAFIHHDKSKQTFGMNDKSEQMKMSTENKPHREEAMRQKAKHVTENVTDSGMGKNIEDLKEKIGDKVYHAKEAVKETAHQVKDAFEKTAYEAKDAIKGKDLGEKVENVKEKVVDKVHQAKEAVGDKVEELKMKIGAKEVKTNPEEFVPLHEVATNSYFDNIHDIDRIKARAEHLTNEQLTDILGREMKLSKQPKDAELKKEMEKRSKLSDPDPEQFVPRKDIEDNKYFDHMHDTGTMQMKKDGVLKVSLEEILREELRKRQLPEPDPEQFSAHMELAENKYFDDIHNVDEMKIKAEHLNKEMEGLRKDLSSSATRDQTPMEEVEAEVERASKSGKMDPFLKEKLGGGQLRK